MIDFMKLISNSIEMFFFLFTNSFINIFALNKLKYIIQKIFYNLKINTEVEKGQWTKKLYKRYKSLKLNKDFYKSYL